MKKYFIFAAVAAAGLFASCSSDDVALNEGGNPLENVGDEEPVKIGIGNLANMSIRGTGTVGGVGTGDNQWYGQRINVFMFEKDADNAVTFKLAKDGKGKEMYNNQVMVTPGSDDNYIDGMGVTAERSTGEAMIEDGTIQYYPMTGNFAFFGYHGDDATGSVSGGENDTKWTVPFTIDGSQDLMSTKAVLTTTDAAAMAAKNNPENYYSAYSARAGVQPTLTFKHLLTRLQFKVKAGNPKTAGWDNNTYDDATTSTADNAVKISKIEVQSKTSGDMIVAWKADEETSATTYEMSTTETLSAEAYSASNNQSHWQAQGTNPETYKWDGATVDAALYATLTEAEKALVSSSTTSSLPDYKKITWENTTAYLPLQERPKYILKEDATEPADGDVTGYAEAKTTLETAKTEYETAEAALQTPEANLTTATAEYNTAKEELEQLNEELAQLQTELEALTVDTEIAAKQAEITAKEGEIETQEGVVAEKLTAKNTAQSAYDTAKATYDEKKEAYDNAKAAADALDPTILMRGTISEAVHNLLSTEGLAKYDAISGSSVNYNLTTLTPIAPEVTKDETNSKWEYAETPVGEALIIAPNSYGADGTITAEDIKMNVTISQRVKSNWITNATETRTETYPLTIKAPAEGFKMNTSYNIILTVYGFERIEVMAVITPWDEYATPIGVGEDD